MNSKRPYGDHGENANLPCNSPVKTTLRSRIITPNTPNVDPYVGNIPPDPREMYRMRTDFKSGPRVPIDRAFADLIYDWQQQVPTGLFLTFVFNQLQGGPRAQLNQMMRRVEEFYDTALRHLLRYPNRASNRDRRPLMIALSETAWGDILKEIGHSIARPNDGRHVHAAFLPFPSRQSRMPNGFLPHLEAEKHRIYIRPRDGERDLLRDIHAVRMDRQWGEVWKYMTKEGGRDRRFADDILILPRAQSELD